MHTLKKMGVKITAYRSLKAWQIHFLATYCNICGTTFISNNWDADIVISLLSIVTLIITAPKLGKISEVGTVNMGEVFVERISEFLKQGRCFWIWGVQVQTYLKVRINALNKDFEIFSYIWQQIATFTEATIMTKIC